MLASHLVTTWNGLHEGSLQPRTRSRPSLPDEELRSAQGNAHRLALREASRLYRARRSLDSSGVAALETLTKANLDTYSVRKDKVAQVPLIAEAIDELGPESPVVNMLEALPADEATFYSAEQNVVDYSGKSESIFRDLERHYGFVGGPLEEYLKYFARPDLPAGMWHWRRADGVRAVAGFSTVPKKDPSRLRKLLMSVASNYMWAPAVGRAHHGLYGGSALTSAHVPSDTLSVAVFDESNAFTAIAVPDWMIAWC